MTDEFIISEYNNIPIVEYFNNKIYGEEYINIIEKNKSLNSININDIRVKGMHNYENIMAALLVINEFGIDKDLVCKVFKEFKGVEHRLEFVRELNNIKYYNIDL